MGDLSKDFSRREFACKCGCGLASVNPALVAILQEIRDTFDRPVKIASGLRCSKRNAQVGGAKRSQHLLGNAADVQIEGVTPRHVAELADALLGGRGGVKAYPTFCHIDVRPGYWRGGLNGQD